MPELEKGDITKDMLNQTEVCTVQCIRSENCKFWVVEMGQKHRDGIAEIMVWVGLGQKTGFWCPYFFVMGEPPPTRHGHLLFLMTVLRGLHSSDFTAYL